MIMCWRGSLALVAGLVLLAPIQSADWTSFRGNQGGGVAEDKELSLPSPSDSNIFKIKLPGPGSSSPIVLGDRLYVTSYSGYGTKLTKGMGGKGGFNKGDAGAGDSGDQKDLKFNLLCINRDSGEVIWQKDIAPKLPEVAFTGFLREHGYASSTPTTDGERIYVFFGKTGVFAFDLKGTQVWQADVGSGTDGWGSGSSPVLYQDILIVNAAVESGSIIGLNKNTGKEVWRLSNVGKNWSSPIIVKSKEGRDEVVLNLPGKAVGLDPKTGKEYWNCKGVGSGGKGYTSSTPVARDGIVYFSGGGGPTEPVTFAVRTGGDGDINETRVLWRKKIGGGNNSPILAGEHLCMISGTITCLSTADGSTALSERLYDARGEYTSPILVGDKIFAITRTSGLYVLNVADKFKELAHQTFAGDETTFNASPAVSAGRLYIRSNEYLYCIGKK